VNGAKVLWVITPGGTVNVTRPGDLIVQLRKDNKNFKQALLTTMKKLSEEDPEE
jgi:hypothetical protein